MANATEPRDVATSVCGAAERLAVMFRDGIPAAATHQPSRPLASRAWMIGELSALHVASRHRHVCCADDEVDLKSDALGNVSAALASRASTSIVNAHGEAAGAPARRPTIVSACPSGDHRTSGGWDHPASSPLNSPIQRTPAFRATSTSPTRWRVMLRVSPCPATGGSSWEVITAKLRPVGDSATPRCPDVVGSRGTVVIVILAPECTLISTKSSVDRYAGTESG